MRQARVRAAQARLGQFGGAENPRFPRARLAVTDEVGDVCGRSVAGRTVSHR